MTFSEFKPNTKTDWYNQTLKDLKGKDFDETLVWKTLEGFEIQPIYAAEDLEDLPLDTIQTAQSSKQSLGWQNRVSIKYSNEKDTNLLIINTLKKGADAVQIDFGNQLINEINLSRLLDKVKLSETPIYFKVNGQGKELVIELKKFINYQMKGGIVDDVLATWMQTGKMDYAPYENAKDVIEATADSPQFRTLSIQSHHFHHAGANAVQELAFTMASATHYLDKLTDKGLKIEGILSKIEFSVSTGTNYFIEIAKIRALRYLWNLILNEFKKNTTIQPSTIHCQSSYFYDSTLTHNTNMLRATTETMSAAIGGADAISVHAFDAVLGRNDDFSERIARNISILMKEEAHLDKTNDPSAGSYFIENLTHSLIKASWELFLKVESMGGIVQAFEDGFIQDEIEKSFQAKADALQNGKIMVGVNKFRFDEVGTATESSVGTTAAAAVATDLKLLKNRRIAEIFE
jgi:methylmalonyl-CoA mutase